MEHQHYPVLLSESISAMHISKDARVIDATFGRGGHSKVILRQLGDDGRLMVIDKDPTAIQAAQAEYGNDPRVIIRHGSYAQLAEWVQELGWTGQVNAILLDLGVSSPQLDDPQRGFSFSKDGPLDMRMDTSRGESAAEWLSRASSSEIATVLKEFGEERFAKRIAEGIVERRGMEPITRTATLAKIIAEYSPFTERHKHPATRSFQAIRIYINRELDELTGVLNQCLEVLTGGGRLAVISFHSLEDRIVKRFFRQHSQSSLPKGLPVRANEITTSLMPPAKAITPSMEEISQNPRARSATLRVAIKR